MSCPLYSQLLHKLGLIGVLVRNSEEWARHGAAAWADMVCHLQTRPAALRVLGVDTEWFGKNPLAVVQVASETHCFVLHLSYFDERRLPDPVRATLEDPGLIKCGVGLHGDVRRLDEEQSIQMASIMDVQHYVFLLEMEGVCVGRTNLKDLAADVCQMAIQKDRLITRSNWELPLTDAQVRYAAEDAVASHAVGRRIMEAALAMRHAGRDREHFDAGAWLARTAHTAAAAHKRAVREHSEELQAQKLAEKLEAVDVDGKPVLPPIGQPKGDRVRVLNKDGVFIFDCSYSRARFYVMERNIAVITKHAPNNPRRPREIQLLFEPLTKTRLCMYYQVDHCELGDTCPYAHGIEELTPDARALMTASPSEAPSCAWCLNVKTLMKHSIVPPSLRRHLPQIGSKRAVMQSFEDQYVPICGQCNSVLRKLYEFALQRVYHEASLIKKDYAQLDAISKCAAYARLLLNEVKLAKVPEERRDFLRHYLVENWRATRLEDMANYRPTVRSVGDITPEFLERVSAVVPGEVRSKATMELLVGDDVEKAKAFVERWREFCRNTCAMLEKPSNHMSVEDWKVYRAQQEGDPSARRRGSSVASSAGEQGK